MSDLADFFITEDFTAAAPATPARVAPGAEQGTLFDFSTYAGPENSAGVENVAAIDIFGEVTA